MKATLTFQDRASANDFASKWSYKTLTGHTISADKKDGSVAVTVDNVDEDRKAFIDSYIYNMNNNK